MDVSDPTNITGIHSLLNYNGDTDLDELEREIIGDEKNIKNNDVDDYKQRLEKLGNALNLDFNDIEESDSEESVVPVVPFNDRPYEEERPSIDNIYQRLPTRAPTRETYTEDQKRQQVLRHVLDGVDDRMFSIDKEKEEDDKAILLEQIDMLLSNLRDEGIDISRVPDVDNSSTLEEIDNVHKILRLKNDRNRYCSFAEECILAGSHTLEWLFDGNKSYWGRHPDLRGWSATVNIKLRRMRYDTSTFVSEMMQDYNLGHGTRIMFELIPSLFLYSKMKKSQYGDSLITSDEMNSAINQIRDINTQ